MRYSIGLLLALLLSSIAGAGASQGSTDQAAIRQARLEQNAAIARHDVNAIVTYWTDDVTICRGLGFQLAGKEAYRKLFEQDDPVSKEVVIYERIPRAIEASSTWPLAFESGIWKGHLGSISGATLIRGRYSAQWVKRAGRWLIRSEVFVALSGSGSGLQMKSAP